jgi:hypothetical protein
MQAMARAVSAAILVSVFGSGCGEAPEGAEGKPPAVVDLEALAQASTSATTIYNGYPVSLSGAQGSLQYFRLFNPAIAPKLNFTLRGGAGDADIYVKRFTLPTLTDFDCESIAAGNNENCVYSDVESEEDYFILVYGYEAFSGATLHAYFSYPLAVGTTRSTSGSTLSRQTYEVDVPAGYTRLQATATRPAGLTGQVRIYVRVGDAPAVPSAVDCSADNVNGTTAACSVANPAPGKAYVMIEGLSVYHADLRVDLLRK